MNPQTTAASNPRLVAPHLSNTVRVLRIRTISKSTNSHSTMLLSGKPVVRVKNELADDVYGLWHVKKIVLQKGRRRYTIIPNKDTYSTKDDAEYYARLRTRRFVESQLRRINNSRRPVRKYLAIATMSLMMALAVSWFKKCY